MDAFILLTLLSLNVMLGAASLVYQIKERKALNDKGKG